MYNDIPESAGGYADRFFRPLNPLMEALRREGETQNIPMIRKDAEMLLKSLLTLKKPQRILEIGTAYGYSALFFAMMRPEAEITSLEIRKEYVMTAMANIKKADDLMCATSGAGGSVAGHVAQGVSFSKRISILPGDAETTLVQMREQEIKPFDMIFMDGPKGHYLRHFQMVRPLLAEDALIVSDNILLGGMMDGSAPVVRRNKTMVRRMKAYLEHIASMPGYETAVLTLGDGIAITVKAEGADVMDRAYHT